MLSFMSRIGLIYWVIPQCEWMGHETYAGSKQDTHSIEVSYQYSVGRPSEHHMLLNI